MARMMISKMSDVQEKSVKQITTADATATDEWKQSTEPAGKFDPESNKSYSRIHEASYAQYCKRCK